MQDNIQSGSKELARERKLACEIIEALALKLGKRKYLFRLWGKKIIQDDDPETVHPADL